MAVLLPRAGVEIPPNPCCRHAHAAPQNPTPTPTPTTHQSHVSYITPGLQLVYQRHGRVGGPVVVLVSLAAPCTRKHREQLPASTGAMARMLSEATL